MARLHKYKNSCILSDSKCRLTLPVNLSEVSKHSQMIRTERPEADVLELGQTSAHDAQQLTMLTHNTHVLAMKRHKWKGSLNSAHCCTPSSITSIRTKC